MLDRLTGLRGVRRDARVSRPGDSRARRGSVLVLVMAILGVLFVTGVAFLMTMNFEAKLIRAEQKGGEEEANVTRLEQNIGDVLADGFSVVPGLIGGSGDLGAYNATQSTLTLTQPTWAELPLVHGLLGQVEPVKPPGVGGWVFSHSTDVHTLLGTLQGGQFGRRAIVRAEVNSELPVGLGDGDEVDADGDGVVDARQVSMGPDGASFPDSQVKALAKVVNDPSNADQRVYLGLRVIPHGAMVDLDDSHPTLVDGVMNPDRGSVPAWKLGQRPYSPVMEEASLRRRFFLPPRVVPASAVQGSALDETEDPPGGGDFGGQLFPPPSEPMFPSGETVRTGEHRYWPFRSDAETDEWTNIWSARIDPGGNSVNYDRRHLVTTISHDDNLMRGAQLKLRQTAGGVPEPVDVLDLMAEATWRNPPDNCERDPAFRFQYVAYPHTLPSGSCTWSPESAEPGWEGFDFGDPLNWCQCQARHYMPKADCSHDLRKGRMRLSLPWLDREFAGWESNDSLRTRMTNLIQEAFLLMLLNARSKSPEWGSFDQADRRWQPAWDKISLTAASLTANMIDFMDEDNDPTRVEVRWFNFGEENWVDPGQTRERWLDKVGQGTCDLEFAGETYADGRPITCQYVYGLERQPFITEVAAQLADDGEGNVNESESVYAVELFNPYSDEIPLEGYFLQVGDSVTDRYPLDGSLAGKGYLVAGYKINSLALPSAATAVEFPSFRLGTGKPVYLLRPDPLGSVGELIVLDEFQVSGLDLDVPGPMSSIERAGVNAVADLGSGKSPWFAPVPADPAILAFEGHNLGEKSLDAAPGDPYPVEVLFANEGSFAGAFPTTGSLLLLMRHANPPVEEVAAGITDLEGRAFTTHLRGLVDSGVPGSMLVEISREIDNGRMPVFDAGMLHHVAPGMDPFSTDAYPNWDVDRPGELMHLPWGQLVFDYFTALPLSNPGPYQNLDPADEVDPYARPRVDQDGLRVHGRINLNAAPWKVISGLPYVPLERIPEAFRKTFRDTLAFAESNDDEALPLGDKLAKGIVAYREARGVDYDEMHDTYRTGDYDDGDNGRGWRYDSPESRRGTGLMAVGELANVRATDSQNATFRIDAGNVDATDGSYLEAIATLACLGDWVTVRSHVFTIYGVLRGAVDLEIEGADDEETLKLRREDVDSRAVRFQQTVDRLPTFMGEPDPVLIGDRTVAKYKDVVSD